MYKLLKFLVVFFVLVTVSTMYHFIKTATQNPEPIADYSLINQQRELNMSSRSHQRPIVVLGIWEESSTEVEIKLTPDPTPTPTPVPTPAPKPAPKPKTKEHPAPAAVTVPAGESQEIARQQVLDKGWDEQQFSCLVELWDRESGWNHLAHNKRSGAYGIPQSLPGNKMASEGDDWQTNPATQIRWGLKYIQGRYTDPCGAWDAFLSKGWY